MTEDVRQFLLPADDGSSGAATTVVEWLIGVGDSLTVNRPVCTVRSDGVVRTLLAPFSGTVVELGADVGEQVTAGALVVAVTTGPPARPTPPTEPEPEPIVESDRLVSPLVRRLAVDHGIDLATVEGSGPDGRITRADIQPLVDARQSEDAAEQAAQPEPETEPDPATEAGPGPTAAPEPDRATAAITHHQLTVEVDATQFERATACLPGGDDEPLRPLTLLARLVGVVAVDANTPLQGTTVAALGAEGETRLLPAPSVTSLTDLQDALDRQSSQPQPQPQELVAVCDLGELGLDGGIPAARTDAAVTAVVTIGRVRAVAVPGPAGIETRPVFTVTAAFDAARFDPAGAAIVLRELRRHLEDPILAFAHEPAVSVQQE